MIKKNQFFQSVTLIVLLKKSESHLKCLYFVKTILLQNLIFSTAHFMYKITLMPKSPNFIACVTFVYNVFHSQK